MQPPSDKGKRLKIYYMTQIATRPPTFVCFATQAAVPFSYARYIENQIADLQPGGHPCASLPRARGKV
ncbi:MAG: hypothetical protein ACLRZH_11570 [Ruthenibacterium lactatiformans]